MEHKKVPDGYCSANTYLSLISTKWTAHVIWLLRTREQMRFGQIQKQLAFVSSKVLSNCLKALEQHGFIWRQPNESIPVTVTYGLTTKGIELANIVQQIVDKSEQWDLTDNQK